MLKLDKPKYRIMMIVNLVLILVGLVVCITGIFSVDANALRIILRIADIGALLFAGFYMFNGYKKDAAKYYKIFAAIYAAVKFVSVVNASVNAGTPFTILLHTLVLTLIIILLMGENLGRNRSFVFCGILIVVEIISLIATAATGSAPVIAVTERIAGLVLALLYSSMTYAKYLDKAERGTK